MCKEMGWDYYTYEKQPYNFIQEIALIMNYEAQVSKVNSKRNTGVIKPRAGLRKA